MFAAIRRFHGGAQDFARGAAVPAGEGEQLAGAEPGPGGDKYCGAVSLGHGGGDGVDLGAGPRVVAHLVLEHLEPEPQRRERRPELVRGVGHEGPGRPGRVAQGTGELVAPQGGQVGHEDGEGQLLRRIRAIDAQVPRRPAIISPKAEKRNQAPIISPTTRGTDRVVTADRPIGDSIISPMTISA